MRVRDYVEGEEAGFDVHKLESVLKPSTVVMMTLRCESEGEKNDWVRAVNLEVRKIREEARALLLGLPN